MSDKLVPPMFHLKAFTCPHCNAYSQQIWYRIWDHVPGNYPIEAWSQDLDLAYCTFCERASIWLKTILVWPVSQVTPEPHQDMPTEIEKDYQEARNVFPSSPRSSAALLRLCVQKLCINLGETGATINAQIASLVSKGLSVHIQQALDIVRVVGNEQVHPGTLDVRDNPEIAGMLFSLVNLIVDDRISKPKAIADLYARLPQDKLKGIVDRDKPKS